MKEFIAAARVHIYADNADEAMRAATAYAAESSDNEDGVSVSIEGFVQEVNNDS